MAAENKSAKSEGKQEQAVASLLNDEQYVTIGTYAETELSTVHIVREVETGRQLLAKTIKGSDPDIKARFINAAVFHKRLEHENIVQVVDYRASKNGQPYLIMEFLEGVTLDQLIDEIGTLEDDEEIATFLFQLCNALEYAHSKKFIHGGLKPSNVILTRPGDDIVIKLLDFGATSNSRELPEHPERVETPYLSPEQRIGKEPTVRSDVFSIAVLAYQIMTGYLPYSQIEDGVVTIDDEAELAPISDYRPDIPDSDRLGRLLEQALQRDPEKRISSISEFGDLVQYWYDSIGGSGEEEIEYEDDEYEETGEEPAEEAEEAEEESIEEVAQVPATVEEAPAVETSEEDEEDLEEDEQEVEAETAVEPEVETEAEAEAETETAGAAEVPVETKSEPSVAAAAAELSKLFDDDDFASEKPAKEEQVPAPAEVTGARSEAGEVELAPAAASQPAANFEPSNPFAISDTPEISASPDPNNPLWSEPPSFAPAPPAVPEALNKITGEQNKVELELPSSASAGGVSEIGIVRAAPADSLAVDEHYDWEDFDNYEDDDYGDPNARAKTVGFGSDINDNEFDIDEPAQPAEPSQPGPLSSGRFARAQTGLPAFQPVPGMESTPAALPPGTSRPMARTAPGAADVGQGEEGGDEQTEGPTGRKQKAAAGLRKVKTTKRRKAKMHQTMTKLMALRKTEVQQSETVSAKFTETFAEKGDAKRSPTKIILRMVATVTILAVSGFLIYNNFDTIQKQYKIASLEFSRIIFKKEPPPEELTEIPVEGGDRDLVDSKKVAAGKAGNANGPADANQSLASNPNAPAPGRRRGPQLIEVRHVIDHKTVAPKNMAQQKFNKHDVVYPYLFKDAEMKKQDVKNDSQIVEIKPK